MGDFTLLCTIVADGHLAVLEIQELAPAVTCTH